MSAAFPLFLLAAGLLSSGWAEATGRKTLAASPRAQAAPVAAMPQRPVMRSSAPVSIVSEAAAGQTGYVHFFLLRDTNDETETQVGIELEGQSIAWSFPYLGVATTPFLKSGTVEANGRKYEVEHLYGIRPFPDEHSMRALRAELAGRVAPYIDDQTPYCYVRARGDPLCLSCLDFVVRMLFPGRFPMLPAVPRDFERGSANAHTTDDLLLYLLGLQGLPDQAARLKRIEKLALPQALREDIVHLVEAMPNETIDGKPTAGRAAGSVHKGRRSAQPSGPGVQPPPIRRRKS